MGGGFPGGKPPQGGRGGRSTVRTGETEFETDPKQEVWRPDEALKPPLASVGLSASVGAATAYGQEKYDVAAWCTLPCEMTEASIKEAYDVCYDFIVKELERREADVRARFFPNM
jgi:hypothetical protein